MSKIILLIFTFLLVNAQSFNFTETRYSDALDRSIELKGSISFLENGLDIKYNEQKKSLHLLNGVLTYKEENQEVSLDEEQKEKIIQYFEILILLHAQDEELLNNMFEVEKIANKTVLTPKGSMSHFVSSIELLQNEGNLKEIKLFLANSDYISIKIDDEIR